MKYSLRALAIAVLLLLGVSPHASAADDWDFAIAPYVLAPNISGKTSLGRFVNGADIDVDTKDILRNLDLGAMIHGEVRHKSGFGAIVDYSFMDLSGTNNAPLVPGAKIKSEVFQGILEAYGSYRFDAAPEHKIDVYGGIRWWQIEMKAKRYNAPSPDISSQRNEDWVDPVIGARWVAEWFPGFRTSLAADIGGFGVGSDFTNSVQGLVIYDPWENVSFAAGYRALWVDYSTGDAGTQDHFSYDTVTHGPQLGVIFRF